MPPLQLTIEPEHQGERLDKYLAAALPEHSRAWYQKQIKDGAVSCNGVVCTSPRTAVTAGEQITVAAIEPEPLQLTGEDIPLTVVYEDDAMIVINKPAGMVVHPAAGNWSGTVVNALIGRDANFAAGMGAAGMRPGIVHRLDKDTSGLLVVAKTETAMRQLSRAFAERKTAKTYAALVYGIPRYYRETITTMIGRHPVNRKKMAVVERHGKQAVSEYELLEFGRIDNIPVSLLGVRIFTGRTHQIRVHLAHIKTPILGDSVYGGHQKLAVERQLLHAWKLKLPHPVTGRIMSFQAPWPEDFAAWAGRIEPLPEQALIRQYQQNHQATEKAAAAMNYLVDDDDEWLEEDFAEEDDFTPSE
ncbi:MAG: RluA family pseudouridine synthase [Victivallales bacterium]|nr:RluA family pseudouridine synthase [Victivallales bacterium]